MGFTNVGMNWNAWAEDWRSFTAGGEIAAPDYWQLDSTPPLETLLADFDKLNAEEDKEQLRARRREFEDAIETVKQNLDSVRENLDVNDQSDKEIIERIDLGKLKLNSALADISNAIDF